MRQAFAVSCAVAALAVACDEGRDIAAVPVMPTPAAVLTCNDNAGSLMEPHFFGDVFDCGLQVSIQITGTTNQVHINAVNAAQQEWNTVFGSFGLPVLRTPSTAAQPWPKFTVHFDLTSAGTYWCGSYSGGTITIARSSSATSCAVVDPSGQNRIVSTANMPDLVKHEFSHALGFGMHLNQVGNHYPAMDDCLAAVPQSQAGFNSSVCIHERQIIYWMYGIRHSAPTVDQEFTETSVSLSPTSDVMRPGSSAQFTATVTGGGTGVTWAAASGLITIPTSTNATATVAAGGVEGNTSLIATAIDIPTTLWPVAAAAPITIRLVNSVQVAPATADLFGSDDGVTLTAIAYDPDGVVVQGQVFNWSVVDPWIVTISPTSGSASTWVTPYHNGYTTVRATAASGIQGSAVVFVEGCKTGCVPIP